MSASPPYAFYVEDAQGRQVLRANVTEEIEGDRKFIVIDPIEWSEPRQ
jgi:hypothetical protein